MENGKLLEMLSNKKAGFEIQIGSIPLSV